MGRFSDGKALPDWAHCLSHFLLRSRFLIGWFLSISSDSFFEFAAFHFLTADHVLTSSDNF